MTCEYGALRGYVCFWAGDFVAVLLWQKWKSIAGGYILICNSHSRLVQKSESESIVTSVSTFKTHRHNTFQLLNSIWDWIKREVYVYRNGKMTKTLFGSHFENFQKHQPTSQYGCIWGYGTPTNDWISLLSQIYTILPTPSSCQTF